MRRLLLALVALPLVLAGCASPDAPGAKGGPVAEDDAVHAPWWPVGAYWDVTIKRGTEPADRVRLVNFWNDSETKHFWLGVADRRVALDHALHDTNPLLGRIHWGILTPHEKGIHAHGMYTFPVRPGDTFGGLMFGREWSLEAERGEKPGALSFTGKATDGATIAYDYDPAQMWFSFIEVKDKKGAPVIRVDVTGHGADARGSYAFLRGRDYYSGPANQGPHEETFEVKNEEIPHKSLAIEVAGRASGPLRIDVLSPAGEIKHSETLTGGDVSRVVEIPSPEKGKWTVRYTGTGAFEGRLAAVGILEYARTI